MNQIVFNLIGAIESDLKSATQKLAALQNCELYAIDRDIKSANLKLAALQGYLQAFSDLEAASRQQAETYAPPIEKAEQIKPKLIEAKQTTEGIHKFTKKELNSMPEKYLMIFKQNTLDAHKRITKEGYIEIRITIEGRYISGTGKDEETAVKRFIAALHRAESEPTGKNITFKKYVENWLETAKKPHIKKTTYKAYKEDCQTLYKAFGNRRVSEIKQLELQKFINDYCEQGKDRTAQRLHVMLSAIFEYAVVDELVRISPMKKVVKPKVHPTHGTVLTREEEKAIWNGLNDDDPTFAQIYAIIMYTGVRRGEFDSIDIKDGWVYVTCEKTRKSDGIVVRSMPVNPMLARVLEHVADFNKLKGYPNDMLSRKIKKYCPNRHTHDLRHTFITRCQEYGIKREIVSMWAGHSADSSITTTIYTHLEQNKEIQLKEAQKLDYEV